MDFIVHGAVRETGEDACIVVKASSEAHAARIANDRGMLVSRVETPNALERARKQGEFVAWDRASAIVIPVVVVFAIGIALIALVSRGGLQKRPDRPTNARAPAPAERTPVAFESGQALSRGLYFERVYITTEPVRDDALRITWAAVLDNRTGDVLLMGDGYEYALLDGDGRTLVADTPDASTTFIGPGTHLVGGTVLVDRAVFDRAERSVFRR